MKPFGGFITVLSVPLGEFVWALCQYVGLSDQSISPCVVCSTFDTPPPPNKIFVRHEFENVCLCHTMGPVMLTNEKD